MIINGFSRLLKKVKRYIERLVYISLGRKEIIVIGDSHSFIFSQRGLKKKFQESFFVVESVGGATISGLGNMNSKTGAGKKFNRIKKKSKPDVYILLIGEVDLGYLLWVKGEPAAAELKLLLTKFKAFITGFNYVEKLIVVSIPLPVIDDLESKAGDVADIRRCVKASQVERTKLTLAFNHLVSELCKEQEIEYLDLDPVSIGPAGVINEYLKPADPNDHHYNNDKYIELLTTELKKHNVV
jgi:hypothetical protein